MSQEHASEGSASAPAKPADAAKPALLSLIVNDIIVYQIMDSIKARTLDFDHILENALSLVIHHSFLKKQFYEKVAAKIETTKDDNTKSNLNADFPIVPAYFSRLISLYLSSAILHGNLRSSHELMSQAKRQLFYSIGLEAKYQFLPMGVDQTQRSAASTYTVPARRYT